MPTQLEVLLDRMEALENELVDELQKQQEEFFYEIRRKTRIFRNRQHHKTYSKQLLKYIIDAELKI